MTPPHPLQGTADQPRTKAGRRLLELFIADVEVPGQLDWLRMEQSVAAIEAEAGMNGWNLHIEQLGDPDRATFMEGYQHAKDEEIEARAAGSGGLDVERLAEALDVLSDDGLEYGLMAPEEREDRDDAAERLAAAYARLSQSSEAPE